MRAVLVTTTAALAALAPAWEALFARIPDAPPFLSPAWLVPWWEVFAPGDLLTVAVWDGERLVGLAPLWREEGPLGCRLLPLGIGLSDALDILIDPVHAAEAGAAILLALSDMPKAWDHWSAEDLLPGAAAIALPVPARFRAETRPQHPCPVLALPDGTSLRDAIPAGKWRKWHMARNRTARRDWRLDAATPDTLAGDLAALFRLHAARWQSRGEPGVLADDTVRRFHERAAPALLAAGLLQLLVLRIDGETAGVFYGFQHGAFACAYLGGFDPAFAFESPGTVLIGAALEAAAGRGARRFSFLRGQEPYKYEWGARDEWTSLRRVEIVR